MYEVVSSLRYVIDPVWPDFWCGLVVDYLLELLMDLLMDLLLGSLLSSLAVSYPLITL